MVVIASESLDPYLNLAAEDLLLNRVPGWGAVLFLWRCDPTVVIGKNQNPWRECNLPVLAKSGVRLARRVSGGGAVYHDPGNLNYAWFGRRVEYSQVGVYDTVMGVLWDEGIRAERMGKSSLGVDGRKVSGTAFCYRRDAVLHHGTLLVDADLPVLRSCLEGGEAGISTHAVASEPAPVVNLSTVQPGLTIDRVASALATGFAGSTSGSRSAPTWRDLADDELSARAEALASPAWLQGLTPRFEWVLGEDLDLCLTVVRGRVTEVRSNQAHGTRDGSSPHWLDGCALTAEEVTSRLEEAAPVADQAAWSRWVSAHLPAGLGTGSAAHSG